MTMTTLSRIMMYCQMWRNSSRHGTTRLSQRRRIQTWSASAAARVSAVVHTTALTRHCAAHSWNDTTRCRNAALKTSRSGDLAYSKSLIMPHSIVITSNIISNYLGRLSFITESVQKIAQLYLETNFDQPHLITSLQTCTNWTEPLH